MLVSCTIHYNTLGRHLATLHGITCNAGKVILKLKRKHAGHSTSAYIQYRAYLDNPLFLALRKTLG